MPHTDNYYEARKQNNRAKQNMGFRFVQAIRGLFRLRSISKAFRFLGMGRTGIKR
ncbi:hypothetical protein [Arundinibacter roseus]|uniref:hypothetical protein n=1 Tax=Arundinibacter roseus TaxID=2070510 RepID=UPI0014046B56|nr:hypothetical protein [Arundinibacter roseus]